jgi:hypothetical protein
LDGTCSGFDLQFTKQYRRAHSIKYSGKVNFDVITGHWEGFNMKGEFRMAKINSVFYKPENVVFDGDLMEVEKKKKDE